MPKLLLLLYYYYYYFYIFSYKNNENNTTDATLLKCILSSDNTAILAIALPPSLNTNEKYINAACYLL